MKSLMAVVVVLLPAIVLGVLGGCASKSAHYSSSVVRYLYPNENDHIETPSVPVLSLPLRVGIAFVPETSGRHEYFTEIEKIHLLKEISSHFKKYDFVKSIEIIPSAYLTRGGSFANLEQIRTMYGTDVITLVSYDQTQFTDAGLASITYWTLIGAYIVPGEKNDTHTMVDAVVYDIKARKMLFRAPGTSHIKGKATPINLSEKLRQDSQDGFKAASKDLVGNLDEQLEWFREKIKEAPQDYQVVHKKGYTAAGRLDGSFLLLLIVLGGCWLWFRKRENG